MGVLCEVRSQGEIESLVGDAVKRHQREWVGRGPTDVSVHLLGSLLLVSMHGSLTLIERRLVECGSGDVVKLIRERLLLAARPVLSELVEEATGVPLVSVHHDVSTEPEEEVLVFSLDGEPSVRH